MFTSATLNRKPFVDDAPRGSGSNQPRPEGATFKPAPQTTRRQEGRTPGHLGHQQLAIPRTSAKPQWPPRGGSRVSTGTTRCHELLRALLRRALSHEPTKQTESRGHRPKNPNRAPLDSRSKLLTFHLFFTLRIVDWNFYLDRLSAPLFCGREIDLVNRSPTQSASTRRTGPTNTPHCGSALSTSEAKTKVAPSSSTIQAADRLERSSNLTFTSSGIHASLSGFLYPSLGKNICLWELLDQPSPAQSFSTPSTMPRSQPHPIDST